MTLASQSLRRGAMRSDLSAASLLWQEYSFALRKLLDLWTYHKTAAAQILPFPEVFDLIDAVHVEEITQQNYLSSSAKNKMEQELTLLVAAKHERMQKKYIMKKDKFLSLVLGTHLLPSDFDYDAQKKLEPDEFETETKAIKQTIKLVKAEALTRKDLVLRVEMIQYHVSQNLDAGKTKELIKVARSQLDKISVTQDVFMFDGQELSVYLDNLEADTEERQVQESVEANEKIKASLGSHPKQGRSPRVPV
ncbi:unnamed protein product [Alopecurus aequalis]